MIDKNTFLYINFSKETILIFGVIREPKGWIKQLELIGEYLRHRRRKMEEIGVQKLYVVIPQPLFGKLQALEFMGEIGAVVTKLYREAEERKKGDGNHG